MTFRGSNHDCEDCNTVIQNKLYCKKISINVDQILTYCNNINVDW